MELRKQRWIAIGAAVSALAGSVIGCSREGDEAPDYVLDESNQTSEGAPESEGETSEVVVESEEPAPVTEEQMDGGMMADAGAAPDAAMPTIVTKSQSCTSKYGSHKSISKITWTSAPGPKLTIKSLTVQVFNSANRSANDVDVYVRNPGAGEYLAFNSGDILRDNQIKTVPYKAPTVVKPNTRIRILTNFDQEGGDPYASCSITIVP